jgi:hypothetical protein
MLLSFNADMERALNVRVLDRAVFIGDDLGQRQNPSAIVILERFETAPDFTGMLRNEGNRRRLVVREAERIALGTPYAAVIDHVKEIVRRLLSKNVTCVLVVDESGVGVPIVEAMRAASMGCRIEGISITSGQRSTEASVPRVELVTKMQLMAQRGEVEIARGCRHGPELKRELVHLELTGKGGGGELDDLAMAMALACWKAKRFY